MAQNNPSNIGQVNMWGAKHVGSFQVDYPGLKKGKGKNPKSHPTIAPTGGYYSLQNLAFTQPLSALQNNYLVASNRVGRPEEHGRTTGSISPEAMTPDIHSYWWNLR